MSKAAFNKSLKPTLESIAALRGYVSGSAAWLKRYECPFLWHSFRSPAVWVQQFMAGSTRLAVIPERSEISTANGRFLAELGQLSRRNL
jgi:hypothetical protein